MIDIQSFKSLISSDDIITIMDSMGISLSNANSQALIFPSVCHHKQDYEHHKSKLWFYTNSMQFTCWVCGYKGDIINLVQHVKNIDFSHAVQYICAVLHINEADCQVNESVDRWQEMRKWLPNAEPEPDRLIEYDDSVLSLFDHLYPQEWLDYGISTDILDKFGIGWYARQACISIPVFFNNKLVGIRGRYTREQDIDKGKYRPICTLDGMVYRFASGACMYGYDQNRAEIEKSHSVILFESEKSVLKAPQYGINNALAVFGSNISKQHIQLLLELGVNDVMLCMDNDYHQVGDADYQLFVVKMKRLIAKLRPYFSISIVWNNQSYDMYKSNIMDIPYDQAMKLIENRTIIY